MSKRLKIILSVMICILLGAILGVGAYLFYTMSSRLSLENPGPGQRTVILDAEWNRFFLYEATTQEQQNYIDRMLDTVKEIGADGVIWSARCTDGSLLVRGRGTKDYAIAGSVAANDGFMNRFDPLKYMIEGANQRKLTISLLASDDTGEELGYEDCEQKLSPPISWAAGEYGLYLCARAANTQHYGEYQKLYENLSYYYYFAPPESTLEDTLWWALRCDNNPEILTAAISAQSGGTANVVLGNYSTVTSERSSLDMFWAWTGTVQETAMPDLAAVMNGKTVPQSLSLGYPRQMNTDGSFTVNTTNCFLMGCSDPNLPLTIEGTGLDSAVTVERYGDKGVWGYLVSLVTGDNVFTLRQNDQSLSVLVVKPEPGGGGGGGAKPDGSKAAEPGQKLRVTAQLCSALYNLNSSDNISQTLYKGAVADVKASRQITWSGALTYAYQLTTGDWVLSSSVELIPMEEVDRLMTAGEFQDQLEDKRAEMAKEKGVPESEITDDEVQEALGLYVSDMVSSVADAKFTGITVEQEESTRCTVLTFTGSGTPAVYHDWEGNLLQLTFVDAKYDGTLPDPDDFISGYSLRGNDDGFTLSMTFDGETPLWGWNVRYEDGQTRIYLKKAPRVSTEMSGPLTGVTVMLDAGHGGEDEGAMGSAGAGAPVEKDVNLAEAMAARYRLEQLGATVYMTRSDDSAASLGERVEAMDAVRPDFFIALHHNSTELVTDVNEKKGVEAYWFYTESKDLAGHLVENICAVTSRHDRGNFYDYYYVTRSNICPAVLLENGFMTNPGEYESVVDVTTLWAEGGAVAKAVLQCVQTGYTDAPAAAEANYNPDKP